MSENDTFEHDIPGSTHSDGEPNIGRNSDSDWQSPVKGTAREAPMREDSGVRGALHDAVDELGATTKPRQNDRSDAAGRSPNAKPSGVD